MASSSGFALVLLRKRLAVEAAQLLLWGALGAAIVAAAFSADPMYVVRTVVIGTALFALGGFGLDVRNRLPRGGTVPEVPLDAHVDRRARVPGRDHPRFLSYTVVVVAASVVAAWIFDPGVALSVLSGQWIGRGIAAVFGMAVVRRWERRHRRTVLVPLDERDDEEPATFYAQRSWVT